MDSVLAWINQNGTLVGLIGVVLGVVLTEVIKRLGKERKRLSYFSYGKRIIDNTKELDTHGLQILYQDQQVKTLDAYTVTLLNSGNKAIKDVDVCLVFKGAVGKRIEFTNARQQRFVYEHNHLRTQPLSPKDSGVTFHSETGDTSKYLRFTVGLLNKKERLKLDLVVTDGDSKAPVILVHEEDLEVKPGFDDEEVLAVFERYARLDPIVGSVLMLGLKMNFLLMGNRRKSKQITALEDKGEKNDK